MLSLNRPSSLARFFLLTFALACFAARSDGADRTVAFSKKLNENRMFDYSELLLKKAIAENPAKADDFKIQLAETYILWKRIDEGMKIISKISKADKVNYGKAQCVLGLAAFKQGNVELGEKAYTNFFKLYSPKNPPKTEEEKKLFEEAIWYLSSVYKQTGKPDKAAEVIGRKKWIPKEQEGAVPDRENIYLQLMTKLDGAERLMKQEEIEPEKVKTKGAWKKTVESTFSPFEELRWYGRDAISAFSYVGKGRAYCLLGKYDDAIKEINTTPELMDAYDDSYERTGNIGLSPGAAARFWLGRSFLGKAAKEKDAKNKEKCYIEALKKFVAVLKNYPGYPRAKDAYADMVKCGKILREDFGKKLKLPNIKPPKGGMKILTPDITKLFREKQYKQLITRLEPLVQRKRNEPGVAEAIQKLAVSYIMENRDLEAMALCDYLATLYPNADGTSFAVLVVGDTMWKGADKIEEPDKKKRMKSDAVRVFFQFLDIAPNHEYAAPIAAQTGKEYFDKAVKLAQEVNALQGAEKKEKRAEAVAAFKKAIPIYQRLIGNYANTQYGPSSYRILGICYASSEQFIKAADTYLKYIEFENKSQKPDYINMLQAKLKVADNYYQGGRFLQKKADQMREQAYAFAAKAADTGGETANADGEKPAEGGETKDVAAEKEKKSEGEADNPKMVEADKLDEQAKNLFAKAVQQLKELIVNWYGKNTPYAKLKDAKAQNVEADAYRLLGWAYDAAGEKEYATKAFAAFIGKFPKNKKVPGSMMRLGTIFIEMGEDNKAERVLGNLVSKYPNSNEGKNARFFLGQSLYTNKKYEKSIAEFKKVLAKAQDVSVQNLRWIASNLTNCGGKHPIDAAELAAQACGILLQRFQNPTLEDWVGKKMAQELKADPAKREQVMRQIREKILVDSGNANFWAGQYKKAIESLTALLENERTPYFYEAMFLRASSYLKMEDFDNGRADLSEISMVAMTAKKNGIYTQAQCEIGDSFIKQADKQDNKEYYKKALAAFEVIASLVGANSDAEKMGLTMESDAEGKVSDEEREKEKEWMEYAVYRTAWCFSVLGDEKQKEAAIEKYKKQYPRGRFIRELRKLPGAK